MQWSNNNAPEKGGRRRRAIPATQTTVVKSGVASESVVDYRPQQFVMGAPSQALDYLAKKEEGSDFRMSDPSRIQTGVDDIEKQSIEEHVQGLLLERLKSVQEEAYKQAYELGLDEGRAEALRKNNSKILDSIEALEKTLIRLETLKMELVTHNEAHLVKLLFSMATRLAGAQLKNDPSGLLNIIRSAVEHAQDEENVKVLIAPEQLEFIESMKKQTGREFEFLKRLQLEPDESVKSGGCVVHTNYGEIDARMEQRVSKLWETLADNLPRSKDVVGE